MSLDAHDAAGPPTRGAAPASPPVRYALSARARERLLALETRRRVFELVRSVPGIHLRRLAREAAMSVGTLEHHLHQLERHGLVASHRESKRRTYYASEDVPAKDIPLLHVLRHRLWRGLVLALLEEEDLDARTLSRAARGGTGLVHYHLRRLAASGWIRATRVGRETLYALQEPERVCAVLRAYGHTFRGPPRVPARWRGEAGDPFGALRARIPGSGEATPRRQPDFPETSRRLVRA